MVQHMELCSMLCASLEGKGGWGRMDTCIYMADFTWYFHRSLFSWHYHDTVNQLNPNTKKRIFLNLYTVLSVQFSRSVVSDSLPPHGLQHTRPPCPSPTPGACSNSCPSSRWYHPTISSSVIPFSCLQSFPESGSFQMSQFFLSGS